MNGLDDMIRKHSSRFVYALAVGLLAAGCASSSSESAVGDSREPNPAAQTRDDDTEQLPPPGYGTLRQDQFTVPLEVGLVGVKVTPMAEEVIRLAAPDTYQRLKSLRGSRSSQIQDIARRNGLRQEPLVVLVSFFTRQQQEEFFPTEVQILSRGILYFPLGIVPLTPDWGQQQLMQQVTQSALYVFDPAIDLEVVLTVEYRGVQSARWISVVSTLETERARVFARAKS